MRSKLYFMNIGWKAIYCVQEYSHSALIIWQLKNYYYWEPLREYMRILLQDIRVIKNFEFHKLNWI